MCEIGMFRSPDGKRIVGLARSQSHNNPSTLIYSDDEGKNWSEPMDLPGSLAGERHKAMYDPISGKLVITSVKYSLISITTISSTVQTTGWQVTGLHG
mgnify:CR=1 FL=1